MSEYEYWLEKVKNNGLALYDVPEEHEDYKLYEIAVSNCCWALYSIPHEHRDDRIIWLANRDNTYPLQLAAVNIIRQWVLKWLYRPSSGRTRKLMYSSYISYI